MVQWVNRLQHNIFVNTATKMPYTTVYLHMHAIMNPARVFIIGIARKFCKPLIKRTKCKFTAPPCWPSNMLKILPEYP